MARLGFGAFLAPHHPIGENPMLQFRRDIAFVKHLDELGYDEFWCGEHHSSGWEMIASPEMFLAAAGEHTKRIKLATGVISLPYHHPYNVAQRMVQLDHMTGGRSQEHLRRGDHLPAGGMMLAAPELVIAEAIQLLDQVEIAPELEHRMLPDRMMRGKEGSELQARHGVLSSLHFLFVCGVKLRAGGSERNRPMSRAAECSHARVVSLSRVHGEAECSRILPSR